MSTQTEIEAANRRQRLRLQKLEKLQRDNSSAACKARDRYRAALADVVGFWDRHAEACADQAGVAWNMAEIARRALKS